MPHSSKDPTSARSGRGTTDSRSRRRRASSTNVSVVDRSLPEPRAQASAERGAQTARVHDKQHGRQKARGKHKETSANIWGAATSQTSSQKSPQSVRTKVPKFSPKTKSLDAKMKQQQDRMHAGVGAGVQIDESANIDIRQIERVQSLSEKIETYEETKRQMNAAKAKGEMLSGSALCVGEHVEVHSESAGGWVRGRADNSRGPRGPRGPLHTRHSLADSRAPQGARCHLVVDHEGWRADHA